MEKKISIEEYNNACRKAVMRYTDIWNDLTLKMGYWVDMESPYVTYENKYIESVWWLIKQLNDKGLLYKGYTVQPDEYMNEVSKDHGLHDHEDTHFSKIDLVLTPQITQYHLSHKYFY